MHGFKSTGNREEDEHQLEFKRLNWNHYVWRTAMDSKRTNDVRIHCPNSIVRLFCQQADKMVDPEGKLIAWHEKNNERKRIKEEQKALAVEEAKKEAKKAKRAAYGRKYRARKKAEKAAAKERREAERRRRSNNEWKVTARGIEYVGSESEDEDFLASLRFKSLAQRKKEVDRLAEIAPDIAECVAEKPPANLHYYIDALEAEEAEGDNNSDNSSDYDSSGDDLPLTSLKEARQIDEIHAAVNDYFESDSDGTAEFEFTGCLTDV